VPAAAYITPPNAFGSATVTGERTPLAISSNCSLLKLRVTPVKAVLIASAVVFAISLASSLLI